MFSLSFVIVWVSFSLSSSLHASALPFSRSASLSNPFDLFRTSALSPCRMIEVARKIEACLSPFLLLPIAGKRAEKRNGTGLLCVAAGGQMSCAIYGDAQALRNFSLCSVCAFCVQKEGGGLTDLQLPRDSTVKASEFLMLCGCPRVRSCSAKRLDYYGAEIIAG